MDYSIIIPYHSNQSFLKACLKSLLFTVPHDVEIIVVMNNSNSNELGIKLNKKRIKIVTYNQDLGYSRAINYGAEIAKGKYLIFCDSDTVYTNNWFANLTNFFQSNNKIGIVSSKLLNPETSRIIDFGMALSKLNNAHPYMDQLLDFELVNKSKKVQMACSANMLIEKKLFKVMGMHDENLVNFYQDNDLCLRLKDFNKECWVVSNSIVYHRGSSSNLSRHSYRADIKGYYVAKNLSRMSIDLNIYYKESFKYFNQNFQKANKYLLIDLSTVGDREWYYDIIQSEFSIIDIYQFPVNDRDLDKIRLIDRLGFNILNTRIPLIYFVDRFIALKENHLWRDLRVIKRDVIID